MILHPLCELALNDCVSLSGQGILDSRSAFSCRTGPSTGASFDLTWLDKSGVSSLAQIL